MKCRKDCRMYYPEKDGYGTRGYECLITRESTNTNKECPFWNKTIEQINKIKNLKNWSI